MLKCVQPYEGDKPYIFVSYCRDEAEQVYPLINALAERGCRIWYDIGLHVGADWPEVIAHRLDNCSLFLCCLSKGSEASFNCKNELTSAICSNKSVIPVIMDDVKLSPGTKLNLSSFNYLKMTEHLWDELILSILASEQIKSSMEVRTKRMLNGISVDSAPTKTVYTVGENFNPAGVVVIAVYLDGSTKMIDNFTVQDGNNLPHGKTFVTLSYTEEGVTKTISVPICVVNPLTGISVPTPPTKTNYFTGETFDDTGMIVTAEYADGSTKPVCNYTITGGNELALESTFITVSYTEDGVTKTVSVPIRVDNFDGTIGKPKLNPDGGGTIKNPDPNLGSGGTVKEDNSDSIIIIRVSTGEAFLCNAVEISIGREKNNSDIIFPDCEGISACHAKIKNYKNKFGIIDNNSTNGTYVNGEKLTNDKFKALEHVSLFSLGHEEFISVYGLRLKTIQNAKHLFYLKSLGNGEAVFIFSKCELDRNKPWARGTLTDMKISRPHASLTADLSKGECFISDIGGENKGSTNGTYINGKRIEPCQPTVLSNGDIVKIGDTELEFSEVIIKEIVRVHDIDIKERQRDSFLYY